MKMSGAAGWALQRLMKNPEEWQFVPQGRGNAYCWLVDHGMAMRRRVMVRVNGRLRPRIQFKYDSYIDRRES